MAKSKRSKVKMAYKAMRRAVMEPKHDEKLREQAGKVYEAIGLPLPDERPVEAKFKPRSHGGSELVSTFVPTPKGPKLNAVHGPLANDASKRIPKQVVGFPIVGAAQRARRNVGRQSMDVENDGGADDERYFFPRRAWDSGAIRKTKKNPRRQQRQNAQKIIRTKQKQMKVEAAS